MSDQDPKWWIQTLNKEAFEHLDKVKQDIYKTVHIWKLAFWHKYSKQSLERRRNYANTVSHQARETFEFIRDNVEQHDFSDEYKLSFARDQAAYFFQSREVAEQIETRPNTFIEEISDKLRYLANPSHRLS